jgi:hypothetical protein
MIDIRQKLFGNATDEEINKYLNSQEYKFYKNGVKEGIWIGGFLGFWIGMLVMAIVVILGVFL